MLTGMEGVMMNEMGGGKKEVVCAQLSCGDPQVYSFPPINLLSPEICC